VTRVDKTTAPPPRGQYVACPVVTCRAGYGDPCRTSGGERVRRAGGVHPSRMALEAATLKNHSAMVFVK
jgi:hypothetical protein